MILNRKYTMVFLLAVSFNVNSAVITDLYNTGVDNSGNVLLGGIVADTHYDITAQSSYGVSLLGDAYTVGSGFPIGPWVANTPTSRWIGTGQSQSYGPYSLTFSTDFTIGSDADLSTVNISGLGGVDDYLSGINLNGVSTGAAFSGFRSLSSFSISSGFVHGINTIDFLVVNSGGGPTGLRIQDIEGTYETVPEPSIIALMGLGIFGLGLSRRKMKK